MRAGAGVERAAYRDRAAAQGRAPGKLLAQAELYHAARHVRDALVGPGPGIHHGTGLGWVFSVYTYPIEHGMG